jgi:hypothetical protein
MRDDGAFLSDEVANISSVTVLYTANLAGVLPALPRLSTLITRERQAAQGPVLLLDLGDTCSLESWICRATQGRAPLMVLDAIGYDAALIGGPEHLTIPEPALQRLRQSLVMPVIMWNTAAELTKQGIKVALVTGDAALPADHPGFRVDRSTAALPEERSPAPTLGDVPAAHLARVEMAWPEWVVQQAHWLPLADDLPADPTIAAIMDLVESEARYYAQHQGGIQ